jgi:uncharacterized protein YeaO (DUF488 family)
MTGSTAHHGKMHVVRVKRVYDPVEKDDGLRVLVDRLWPRGLSKEKAHVDLWLKNIAPSDGLRRHFHERPDQWDNFKTAYARELAEEPAHSAAGTLHDLIRKEPVTLLYSARDEIHNNAVALKAWLEKHA